MIQAKARIQRLENQVRSFQQKTAGKFYARRDMKQCGFCKDHLATLKKMYYTVARVREGAKGL